MAAGTPRRPFACRELLRNPLILSTLGGLLADAYGFHLPEAAATTLQRIGLAALPVGPMAVGAGQVTVSTLLGMLGIPLWLAVLSMVI